MLVLILFLVNEFIYLVTSLNACCFLSITSSMTSQFSPPDANLYKEINTTPTFTMEITNILRIYTIWKIYCDEKLLFIYYTLHTKLYRLCLLTILLFTILSEYKLTRTQVQLTMYYSSSSCTFPSVILFTILSEYKFTLTSRTRYSGV